MDGIFLKRFRRVSRAMRNNARTLLGGNMIRVPVQWVTNEYGFSMAPEGWNYFRALVAEIDHQPDLTLEESTFYRFFQHPLVREARTLNDVLFLHEPKRARKGMQFYLGTYPWGHWDKNASLVGGKPYGLLYDEREGQSTRDLWGYRRNLWYEPGDPHALCVEWEQTVSLFRSMRRGYRPFWNGSLPEVTLLLRRDGATRAVRFNGQHRLAILSHLGRQNLTVALGSDSLQVIREADVSGWYYVQNGKCPVDQALEIFHSFFELNGRERIRALGLPEVY